MEKFTREDAPNELELIKTRISLLEHSDSQKMAYTIEEFCHWSGIGRTMAFKEIKAGRLASRKAGARTLILRRDAEAWLEALPSGA